MGSAEPDSISAPKLSEHGAEVAEIESTGKSPHLTFDHLLGSLERVIACSSDEVFQHFDVSRVDCDGIDAH